MVTRPTKQLLLEENIDSADVFVALTNAEEANILVGNAGQAPGRSKSVWR